jgi:hypothetical protein
MRGLPCNGCCWPHSRLTQGGLSRWRFYRPAVECRAARAGSRVAACAHIPCSPPGAANRAGATRRWLRVGSRARSSGPAAVRRSDRAGRPVAARGLGGDDAAGPGFESVAGRAAGEEAGHLGDVAGLDREDIEAAGPVLRVDIRRPSGRHQVVARLLRAMNYRPVWGVRLTFRRSAPVSPGPGLVVNPASSTKTREIIFPGSVRDSACDEDGRVSSTAPTTSTSPAVVVSQGRLILLMAPP